MNEEFEEKGTKELLKVQCNTLP